VAQGIHNTLIQDETLNATPCRRVIPSLSNIFRPGMAGTGASGGPFVLQLRGILNCSVMAVRRLPAAGGCQSRHGPIVCRAASGRPIWLPVDTPWPSEFFDRPVAAQNAGLRRPSENAV
jgi:hypothetical protein